MTPVTLSVRSRNISPRGKGRSPRISSLSSCITDAVKSSAPGNDRVFACPRQTITTQRQVGKLTPPFATGNSSHQNTEKRERERVAQLNLIWRDSEATIRCTSDSPGIKFRCPRQLFQIICAFEQKPSRFCKKVPSISVSFLVVVGGGHKNLPFEQGRGCGLVVARSRC